MPRDLLWRLYCASPPDQVYAMWTSDAGRMRFWAEESRSEGPAFRLRFPDGTEEVCTICAAEPLKRFTFTYFRSEVELSFTPDEDGGTVVELANRRVPEEEYEEALPGWVSVLLAFKAAVDFGIDIRNHDPRRTWGRRYVDQ